VFSKLNGSVNWVHPISLFVVDFSGLYQDLFLWKPVFPWRSPYTIKGDFQEDMEMNSIIILLQLTQFVACGIWFNWHSISFSSYATKMYSRPGDFPDFRSLIVCFYLLFLLKWNNSSILSIFEMIARLRRHARKTFFASFLVEIIKSLVIQTRIMTNRT
jgi:hypothetical protein